MTIPPKNRDCSTRSLKVRTLLVLCLFLLPFSLGSIILSLHTLHTLNRTLDTTINATLDSYTSQLSGKMDTADYLLLDTSTNNTYFHQYMKEDDWHRDLVRYQLSQNMSNSIKLSSCADGMFLYHPEREDLVIATRLKLAEDRSQIYIEPASLRELLEDPGLCDGKWHVVETEKSSYLYHVIVGTDYRIGAYINCDDLLSSVSSGLGYEEAEVLLTEAETDEAGGQKTYYSEILHSKARLVYRVSKKTLFGSALIRAYLSIVLFVLSVLLIPVFSYLFVKHVDRPLKDLRDAFHELEQGNQDYRIEAMADSSEFAYAEKSFNTMADNLEELQEKVLEDEKKQHELITDNLELQLNNLQLQIRPHFLQNTMNLLYTLIQNQQSENAQRLVLYLSRYFRYMFRYGRDLELFDKELEMVKEYLAISELHYQNSFSVSYQIDPILSFMRVPPLLIHNFVENIIQHALIPGRTIHVILYGEYDDDKLQALLQISDDGNGFSQEYADRINRNDFERLPEGKHIGIRNSIKRLRHYYGEEASVMVETAEGAGTTFSIRIPCDLTDVE